MATITLFPIPFATHTISPLQAPQALAPKRKRAFSMPDRKTLLAKVHVAKKQLGEKLDGFEEYGYKAILAERFGVESSRNLDGWQLEELLLYMQKLGFEPKKGKHRKQAPHALDDGRAKTAHTAKTSKTGDRSPKIAKIEAMLAEKGAAEGTGVPWAYAIGILKRQSGGVTKTLDHATDEQLDGLIAALYRDAKRNGRRVR